MTSPGDGIFILAPIVVQEKGTAAGNAAICSWKISISRILQKASPSASDFYAKFVSFRGWVSVSVKMFMHLCSG